MCLETVYPQKKASFLKLGSGKAKNTNLPPRAKSISKKMTQMIYHVIRRIVTRTENLTAYGKLCHGFCSCIYES